MHLEPFANFTKTAIYAAHIAPLIALAILSVLLTLAAFSTLRR